MIKNALILKRERIEWRYLFLFGCGICLGMVHDVMGMVLTLVYLGVSIKKGRMDFLLGTMGLLGAQFVLFYEQMFISMLFVVTTLIFVKLYEYFRVDFTFQITVFHAVLLSLVLFILHYDLPLIASCVLSVVILQLFFMQHQKEKEEDRLYLFAAAASLYLVLVGMKDEYALLYTIAFLILCAYTLPFDICFAVFLYMALQHVPYIYLLLLLFINFAEGKRMLYSLFAFLSLLYEPNLNSVLFSVGCVIAALFSYQENETFLETTKQLEHSHRLYMQHSFYRQLMDYSSIFYDLSLYYEDVSFEHSQMLKLMGEAMEHNAKLSKRYFHEKEELSARIMQVLKGYKFTVLKSECQQSEKRVKIVMELVHLYKGELEEVIIPLLEKVTQSKLHPVHIEAFPFQKEKIRVILESEEFCNITTYGDSIHVREVNGDSYHSVSICDSVVCMMSDGMGQGSKAKKVSSLLIHMLETMMRCEIPQVECVKMLNHFMRSDIYATLDVLSFDRKQNVAYLSKSASAPTYLYRNGVLHEMNAHSLPIGIVENIQADVFEIPFYKGDIFLMVSDGVSVEEVERWVGLKRCLQIKNEGLNMMNILKEKRRSDDSSILLAMVN